MSTTRTVRQIADALDPSLRPVVEGNDGLVISSIDTLEHAGAGGLTFLRSNYFARKWAGAQASAALVPAELDVPGHDHASRALIRVTNVELAMVRVLTIFAPDTPPPPTGVHETAVVDPSAAIAPGASVGPFVTIGANSTVADGAVVCARVHIGRDCAVGPNAVIHENTVIHDRTTIGATTVIHSGVVIGTDGFGYTPAPDGNGLVKIPHIGHVEIGSAVEIGAGTCIDRGKFGPTVVGDGTKIDNLCQIGHNVKIGRSVIICGLAGIAGSVVIEDGAVLAGSVGVVDNKRIGARATVTARSGVMSNIPPGETWSGYPAKPHHDWLRMHAATRKISAFFRQQPRTAKSKDA